MNAAQLMIAIIMHIAPTLLARMIVVATMGTKVMENHAQVRLLKK